MTAPDLQVAPAPPPSLTRVAYHAIASGLTPLIPVPMLDDLALRRVRERMVRDLLADHGIEAPAAVVETLAGSERRVKMSGRVRSSLRSLVLFPVKKVFRKVFFVLWVKDCVDMASGSLHHGYLLRHALSRGHLDVGRSSEGAARQVYGAIQAACDDVDPRPVNQVLGRLFKSSRLLLAEATRTLLGRGRAARRRRDDEENREVQSLADRLVAALRGERGYFEMLAARYDQHYAAGLKR